MTPEDRAALRQMADHHRAMSLELGARVDALVEAVEAGQPHRPAADEVLAYVRREVLPHAEAEERTVYAAAAARVPALVEALTLEHADMRATLDAMAAAASGVRAAAAGYALAGTFELHARKEETLVLPALAEDSEAHLAEILDRMHERFEELRDRAAEAVEAGAADPSLDVREEPPSRRHTLIFDRFDALPDGGSFVLVNDHDPKPLFYQLQAERADTFTWEALEQGPEVWRVRIGRAPAAKD